MVASNKIIQVPIDEGLLAELDEVTRAQGMSRSAVIRNACRDYIRHIREQRLDDAYQRGYEKIPEDPALAKAQAAVAAKVLPKEAW